MRKENHRQKKLMRTKPEIAICTISDIATDYRLHKMALTISKTKFSPYFITRRRKDYINKSSAFTVKIMRLLFEKGPFFYMEYNIRLFFILLIKRPDVIFSVDLDTLTGTKLASLFLQTPVIFDSHEYFPESPELQHRPAIKKIWQKIEKIFVPKIDHGITVCGSIADIYRTKYNKDFKVIRNLPLAENNNMEPKPVAGIKDNTFTLIYQGAVNVGRGLKEIIESLTYLQDVNLIIVGDGDIFEDIKQQIKELNLTERVTTTGKIPFQEIPFYTNQADMGLILLENMGLNYYYSLPNRVFDFIKHQTPILATDFPEIKKVVEGYNVGHCTSSMEPKHLAGLIEKLKSDKQQMELWKNNCKAASKELVWENDEKQLIETLNNLG